jgi:outer membrane protein assembly factor BamB
VDHQRTSRISIAVLATIAVALAVGAVIGVYASASSGAAAGVVPTYRGNAARTGEMAGPGPAGSPSIAWRVDAGGAFGNSPVIGQGVVFAASADGEVRAVSLADGSPRWSVKLHQPVSASPVLVGDLVIVGDELGKVHGLAVATGAEAWNVTTDGAITGSPAAVGGDVIVATQGSHAFRLEAATGHPVWSVDVGGATARSVATDGVTAFLGVGGELVAIGLGDGRERWRTTVAGSGDVGTPAIAGGLVYASTGIGGDPADAGVAVLDAATGAIRWRYASPAQAGVYTPAVSGGRAFVLGHDGLLVALDATTGTTLWTTRFESELEALPSVVGDTVYVIGNDGPAAAVDAATGSVRWTVPIAGVPFAPSVADGFLVVGTNLGHLYAIRGS